MRDNNNTLQTSLLTGLFISIAAFFLLASVVMAQNALKVFLALLNTRAAVSLSQHRCLTSDEVIEIKKSFRKLRTDHPILMLLKKEMDQISSELEKLENNAQLYKKFEEIHEANKKAISDVKKAVSVDAETIRQDRTFSR